MINYVYSYLNKYYKLNVVNAIGESTICKQIDDECTWGVYPNTLVKELKTIFSVDEEDLKAWIVS